MPAPAYAPLDDALEMLSPYGIGLANGNFNHVKPRDFLSEID